MPNIRQLKKEDKSSSSATKESRGWAEPLSGLKMVILLLLVGSNAALKVMLCRKITDLC